MVLAHTTPAECRLRRVLVKFAFMPVALAVSASGLLLGAAAIAHNYGYTERWAWAPDVCMLIAGLVYLSFPIQAWRRGWQLMRGGPLREA